MFRWLTDITSPRSFEAALRVTNDETGDNLMTDLVVSEVEEEVAKFEAQEDVRKSQVSLQSNVPDYSWLAVNKSVNRRRLLTLAERAKIESMAELLKSEEWNQALQNWRGRLKSAHTREAIIDAWTDSVNEVVGARPPQPSSVADQLVSYLRHRPSVGQAKTGMTPRDEDTVSQATELSNVTVSTVMPVDSQRSFSEISNSSPRSPPASGRQLSSVAPLPLTAATSDICDAV